MKKKPNKLEVKKLFKEFGFLKADEEYKNDLIQNISPEFREAIRSFLKNRPDLNTLFGFPEQPSNLPTNPETNERVIKNVEKIKMIADYISSELGENGLIVYSGDNKYEQHRIANLDSPKEEKLKKLYRQIATKTHPDKIKLKFLNDMYIKAKNCYEKKDLFSIYLLCNDLDIEYKLEDDEISSFSEKINALRNDLIFVEQTYLWMWYFEEDENKRNQILNHFIVNNPNHVRPIFQK